MSKGLPLRPRSQKASKFEALKAQSRRQKGDEWEASPLGSVSGLGLGLAALVGLIVGLTNSVLCARLALKSKLMMSSC